MFWKIKEVRWLVWGSSSNVKERVDRYKNQYQMFKSYFADSKYQSNIQIYNDIFVTNK